jgi:hypothetical protein
LLVGEVADLVLDYPAYFISTYVHIFLTSYLKLSPGTVNAPTATPCAATCPLPIDRDTCLRAES